MIAFYRILMLSVVVRLRLKADQCKAFLLYFAGFARMFRKIAHQNAVKQRTHKMALKRFTLDPCMIDWLRPQRRFCRVANLQH